MDPKLHDLVGRECRAKGVECIDLWGPLLASFETRFGAKRSGKAGRKQPVSEDYMTIAHASEPSWQARQALGEVKAIEYTRKVDDGASRRDV